MALSSAWAEAGLEGSLDKMTCQGLRSRFFTKRMRSVRESRVLLREDQEDPETKRSGQSKQMTFKMLYSNYLDYFYSISLLSYF